MPTFTEASTFYDDADFGFGPDAHHNVSLDLGWYGECGSESHVDLPEVLLTSPEAPSPSTLFDPTLNLNASPISFLSSPGRSESDSAFGNGGSSSGSDSDAEGDLDQGNWTIVDDHSYTYQAFTDPFVEDTPYEPPSAPSTNRSELVYPSPTISDTGLPHSSPAVNPAHLSSGPEIYIPSSDESHPRASRSRANQTISYLFAQDSDADAEGESDSDDSEDDYSPSPSPPPVTRLPMRSRGVYNYAYLSCSDSSSPSSSYRPRPSAHARPRPTAPVVRDSRLRRTQPRHTQAATPLSIEDMTNFTCNLCGYIQRNKRKPDFKRHLQTHNRGSQKEEPWVCCGVLENSLDAPRMATPTLYKGFKLVGGCFKVFSRRDALKRHLDNQNICCKGDMSAEWYPKIQTRA